VAVIRPVWGAGEAAAHGRPASGLASGFPVL